MQVAPIAPIMGLALSIAISILIIFIIIIIIATIIIITTIIITIIIITITITIITLNTVLIYKKNHRRARIQLLGSAKSSMI